MADTYLEYDYLPEKKKRRRALRKRPRWPFVLLGFFIGFVTLPALIALTVFLIVSRPVEKTVNTIDKMTNVGLYEMLFGSDDKVGYLDERYGEMSLSEALEDIVKIAEKGSELTFEDLSEISPQVTKSIDKLIESAEEKSIILDKEEVMTTPLNQFSDLLMDEVKEIELGEVLLATKSDIFDDPNTGAILKNLFFGKAGVNYTEIDGKITMLPISYVYDSENKTFTCVDETVYTQNGALWTTENGDDYIAVLGEGFALYSSYGDVIYQLQPNGAKSFTSYTAVTVNTEGLIEEVKQKSLALGAFMGEDSNPMDIIGKLELGTLLGITTKGQAEDDGNKMLVSLAYGAYGVDFEYDGDSDDSRIIYKNGGKAFTTLGDLMNSPDQVLNSLQLGSLLGITTKADAEKDGNGMLVALAYGTYGVNFKYDGENDDSLIIPFDENQEFTTLGDLINSPDEILNGMQLGSLLGITTKADAEKDGNGMLVALAYGTYGTDFEYDGDSDDSLIVPIGTKQFTTLGDLMENPDEILNGMQLGSLLGVTTHADALKDSNKMLIALAYGTYGEDFEYKCNDVVCEDTACENPDCKIVAIGDTKFTTLGDLIESPDEILNGMQLGALLGITTEAQAEDDANKMLVALAYGTFGVDFTYDDNGNIKPIGDTEFTTLGDLINSPDEILNGIQLGSLLGITTKADAEKDSNKMLVALAYGTYGTDFEYDGDSDDSLIVPMDDKQFTTLGDLINKPDEILNGIQLGSLLGITTEAQAEDESNKMLVALAYGTFGVDFTYDDNGNIKPIGDTEFTTLGDLMDNPDEILNGMQLGSLLGVTTHADALKDSNKMLIALAYGTYGTDFEYKCNDVVCEDSACEKTDCKIVAIGDTKFTTLGDLIETPDEILNGMQLGSLLGITTKADVDSGENDMMVAIAYGTFGVDFNYDTKGNIIPVGDKKFTTLGELLDTPDEVLQEIQLGSLLGITTKKDVAENDSLLVTIAYGTYDVDFIYDGDSDDSKIIAKEGGKPFTTVKMLMDSEEAEEIFKNIPLSSIFAVDIFDPNADPLTVSLIYGTKGKHYDLVYPVDGDPYIKWLPNTETTDDPDDVYSERTFGELRDGDLTDIVNDLKVSDVFEIKEDSPKLLHAIKDWHISDLSKDEKIKGLTLSQVIEIDAEDNFLSAMGEWKIGEISEEKIKTMKLANVLSVDEGATGLIATIVAKDWTIGDLTEENIQTLQLKDVIQINEGDDFLAAMGDWQIGEIKEDKIKTIELSKILGDQSNATGLIATIVNKGWTVNDLTEANIKTLYLKDVITINEGDNFLAAIGEWQIGEISEEKIKTIELSKILNIKDGETGMLATIVKKGWTINDLNETNIQGLTLGEVLPGAIGDGENDFFAALKDTPLSELDADYIKDTLTIGQALGITDDNKTEYGILTTFKDTYIKDFNEELLKSTLTIGDVVDTDHPILNVLKDKHLDEINEDLIQSELEKLKLSQVIELEDGEELHPIFKTLQNETLGDITKGDLIDGITVGKAIGMESTDDPILKQIIDLKLGDLKTSSVLKGRINNLHLYELIEDLPTTGILGEMRNWTIGEIDEDKVNSIKLSSIFTVESGDTGLLATLVNKTDSEGKPWTLEDLTSDNINALTLSEVLGEAEVNGNFYLKHLSGSTLGTLAGDIQNISVVDLFADSVYDENGNITGTWKYLLTQNPDEGNTYPTTAPEDYKVTDMSQLIENMHNNIEHASLHALHDDGIIPHLGEDGSHTLDQKLLPTALTGQASYISELLKLNADQDISTMTIGDLTVLQASDYLGYLLNEVLNPSSSN